MIPERHVETFRDVRQFPPDEAQRMLAFVARTAREAGLDDYRVVDVERHFRDARFVGLCCCGEHL